MELVTNWHRFGLGFNMDEQNLKQIKIVWTLKQLKGFGIQKFRRLCEDLGSLERMLDRSALSELQLCKEWSAGFISRFSQAFESGDFERELDQCSQKGIHLISVLDPDYPKRLASIYDPPLVLYVKGTLVPEDEAATAIVGTRHPTLYGRRIACRFARELAARGATIVSGMARGIDSESHQGALQAEGRTIAVLGSGLDVIYPKENAALFERITEHGAVVSEFPLGMKPLAFNFPLRNRIISGLSMGVLVVEASERSGSLITAACALDEGREVYAVPGLIDSVTSCGTNQLIQKGAKLILSPDDILEDLAPQIRSSVREWQLNTPQLPSAQDRPRESHPEEEIILKLLRQRSLAFDEILMLAGDDPAVLSGKLTALELEGKVRRELGGRYVPVSGISPRKGI